MKGLLGILLLAAVAGCSGPQTPIHALDGKTTTLDGSWNGFAKESAQILCAAEPTIVDVVDIGGRPIPEHGQRIRVTATLHWRGMSEEEKKWAEKNAVQGIPDGYIIRWSEASWRPVDERKAPNQSPEPTTGLAPGRGSP